MVELAIKELLKSCDKTTLVYLASLVVLIWGAIKTYLYFAAENVRAKRQKKLILLMIEICNPAQAAWLTDDSRNGEPPR